MEYEILEQAFQRAGQELEEAKKSKDLLTAQLTGVEQEREALAQRVRSLEALASARAVDTAAQAAREAGAAAVLAEQDAAMNAQAEDLQLERDIVAAVRQQVEAAEAERTTSAARIDVLRARLADVGGGAAEGPTGEASWEALLHEQVRALEEGLAARDAELSTLRAALDGSRKEVRRLQGESTLPAVQADHAAALQQLQRELVACKAELESKGAEAAAATGSAALMRARLAEQAHWIARRDDQLASMRREAASLREEVVAVKEEGRGIRAAVMDEGAKPSPLKKGAKAADGGEALDALSAAEWAARVAALREQLATLESTHAQALATASARLSDESAQTQKVHGELQASQQALAAAREEAEAAAAARRHAEARAAALDGERRTKSLEVSRLSSEVGAMGARLQASAQEVRSTDQLSASLRAQRSSNERELARLRDGGSLRDDLNAQLKTALARESERVATAWSQREGLRATLQTRDDALEKARAELGSVQEALHAAKDELEQLREQRRLSEILLRGAEERSSLRQHATTAAREESATLAAEVAALQNRLTSLKEVELVSKQSALANKEAELQQQQMTTESRDERVALLTTELSRRSEEILSLRSAVGQKEEALRALSEGRLKGLEEERDVALAEARMANAQRDDALDSLARLQKVLERRSLEVGARGEQLKVSHESALLLTLEATLKDERLQSLMESLHAEKARHEREANLLTDAKGEVERLGGEVLALTSTLARERERAGLLELRLAQRDEQASNLIEELRMAEARGDGREARMQLLKQRAAVAAEERELFDARLGELHTRMETHEMALATARDERMMLISEATSARAAAEGARAEAHGLRSSLSEADARLNARDEQLNALNARLSAAREELDVQLAMVQEEVRGAQIRLEAKDVALDLQLEEALGREQQAAGFMSEVGERLRAARDAMASKDELLSSLQSKLHASVSSLREHEEAAGSLRRAAAADRSQRDEAVHKLTRLEERHELVQADFHAAHSALDQYRDNLVHAEVRMKHDRDTVAALQQQLRDLHATMARPPPAGAPALGVVPSTLPTLPPLGGAAAGANISDSRVHFLYFLSSFLLLKTALSSEGQMANVNAHEVFEEIVRNEVPLEEWPTYIFTRVYSQKSSLYDSEIAALKAVAQRSEARKVMGDVGNAGNVSESKPASKQATPAGKVPTPAGKVAPMGQIYG